MPWTIRSCLVIRCALVGTAAVPHASPPAVTRWNIWCRPHSGRRGLVAEGAASHGLIIRLIIHTIRRDPTGSDQIDEAPNLSRPDPSGADQIDAEHQATDLAVGGSNPSRRATKTPAQRPCDGAAARCQVAGLRPNCDHVGGHCQPDCDHLRPPSPMRASLLLVSAAVEAPASGRLWALPASDVDERASSPACTATRSAFAGFRFPSARVNSCRWARSQRANAWSMTVSSWAKVGCERRQTVGRVGTRSPRRGLRPAQTRINSQVPQRAAPRRACEDQVPHVIMAAVSQVRDTCRLNAA